MHKRGKLVQRLGALFGAGVLLFNYPLLSLFDSPQRVGGVPLLYLYLFGTWALVLLLVRWLMGRSWH